MAKEILNLNQNDEPRSDSVEDVIARGASAAVSESGTATEPGTDSGIEIIEPKPRRKYTRRKRGDVEPSPEELQQQQAAAELEAFFSPEGIGRVFTTGLDAFYASCNAPVLVEAERDMLARVFSQWAKYRLPQRATEYQPDILLVASIGMVTLPRIKPIAETTAPWWKRVGAKLLQPFRRRKMGEAP